MDMTGRDGTAGATPSGAWDTPLDGSRDLSRGISRPGPRTPLPRCTSLLLQSLISRSRPDHHEFGPVDATRFSALIHS